MRQVFILTLFSIMLMIISIAVAAPQQEVAHTPDGLTTAEWHNMQRQIYASITITQQTKLIPNDIAIDDHFGRSVSISGDTAIVGAHGNDDADNASGSAYIFVRNGTTWTEQQKLTASDAAAGDHFGYSVAINGDTAVVGAYANDDDGHDSGSAYVFIRNGTTWTEQQKLTASDAAADDIFGVAVVVNKNTIIIGAPYDDDGSSWSGSAYVFVRNGTTWTEQQKLVASDAAMLDYFGRSVAINEDTAVIGAYRNDDDGFDSGSAYVFIRNDTTWAEQQKLTAGDAAASNWFGRAVAVDGDTVIVGAYMDNRNGNDSGSAYVFTRNDTIWTEQQKLTASDAAAGDHFGRSVTISGDTVVIGAPRDNNVSGAAYIFTHSATMWVEQQKLTASDAAVNNSFGYSVVTSGDTIISGAAGNDSSGIDSGSAYVFAPAPAFIYLPVIMKPAAITNLTTPAINDTTIISRPVTLPGEVFYTQVVTVASPLPSDGKFYLSSEADILALAAVDDEVAIILNGNELFAYRYGQLGVGVPPALVEVPRLVMEQIAGDAVTFEFRDVYGSVVSATELYLVWTP